MKKISLNPEQLHVESFPVDAGRGTHAGTVQGHLRAEEGADLFVTNAASGCATCAATCETLICVC